MLEMDKGVYDKVDVYLIKVTHDDYVFSYEDIKFFNDWILGFDTPETILGLHQSLHNFKQNNWLKKLTCFDKEEKLKLKHKDNILKFFQKSISERISLYSLQ